MHVGKKVKKSKLRKGDLVFFYSGISHVGIYAGKGKIIHASRPGTRSRTSRSSTCRTRAPAGRIDPGS